MKVRCLRRFDDLKEKVPREAGDIFEVTEARFKEINSTAYGQLVEKIPETRRRTAAKKGQ